MSTSWSLNWAMMRVRRDVGGASARAVGGQRGEARRG
jgi:hypothetical protein